MVRARGLGIFAEKDVIAFFNITVSYRLLGIRILLLPTLCMCTPFMKKLLPVSFTDPDTWEDYSWKFAFTSLTHLN